MTLRSSLATFALGAAIVLGGAATARADSCAERLRREEFRLERDIARHGLFSRQARQDRERIARLRSECAFNNPFIGCNRGRLFDSGRFLSGRNRGVFISPALRGRGHSCNRGRRF